MTTTISRFKDPEIENQGSTSTTLETDRKKKNSRIYDDKLRGIERQARGYSHEIAVYNLAEPVRPRAHYPISNKSENLPRTRKKVEATNPYQQRSQGLRLYLDSLKNEVRITGEVEFSEKVIELSWSVWEAIKSQLLEVKGLHLEVPDACPGAKDNFMYTWSKAEHYLECEIFGTGEIEFFYRNRNNGQVWGEDTTLEQAFSTDILDKASLFIK